MVRMAWLLAGIAALGSVPATAQTLTKIASFEHQATGVAISADGRRFVNFPRWTEDAPISVAEVMKDGSLRPYPDARWNSWRNAKSSELPVSDYFVCVQSIVPDGAGNLWVVDPGAPGNEKILPGASKLVKIDLATNQVTKVIAIPGTVALQGSYLNDIRFSPDGTMGYIADSGTRGAIIVVDLRSGKSWRTLDGSPTTQIDKTVKVTLDGKPLVRAEGRQPAFAADGIAISDDKSTGVGISHLNSSRSTPKGRDDLQRRLADPQLIYLFVWEEARPIICKARNNAARVITRGSALGKS